MFLEVLGGGKSCSRWVNIPSPEAGPSLEIGFSFLAGRAHKESSSVLLEQRFLVASCALSLKAAEKIWRKQPQVNWKRSESVEI